MPPSGKDLIARLDHLRENRTSGALDLALEAIALAQAWIAADAELPALAAHLEQMHPGIATVRNVGRLLHSERSDVARRLKDLEQSLRTGNQRIAAALKRLIPPGAKIITLSNSSTVRESLAALHPSRALVMESLPGGEGRSMARAIRECCASSDTTVQLIPDSSIGNIVPNIDCALVGIDTFDLSGAIYHKTGTLPLALCCRHFDKPFYAAGHTLKRIDEPLRPIPDPNKSLADQIFDHTPAEFITQLVTEQE